MNTNSTQQWNSRGLKSLVQQLGKLVLAIPVFCLIILLLAFGGLKFKTVQAEYWMQHTQNLTLLVISLASTISIFSLLFAVYLLNRLERQLTDRDQVEEQLRDSEERFRKLVELCPYGIYIHTQGKFRLVNPAAVKLFGAANAEELIGKPVLDLLHPEYQEIVQERIRQLRDEKKAVPLIEEEWFRLDGTSFYAEVAAIPFTYQNEFGIQVVICDITKRKQADAEIRRLNESLERRAYESETRYKQIVELAEEGIWVIDSQAKTIYVNQAMVRMLGYTETEMLGHPLADFVMGETDYQKANSDVECRKQGIAEKHELKLKAKNGQAVWAYMSTSPVLDENGKMLWSCALVYDITKRKYSEEQLRQSSERISLANAELARATRLKDEFLASMSHELRTPLNAILGLSEALQEEVFGGLTAKQHQSLATIEQSGKHLLDLINDILDLSKIESGKMELQMAPVSTESLCQASLTFVKQQAHRKTLKLCSKIADGLGEIVVDERRMRQVLINLLSNAVKFTPEGGEVWLEVEADFEGEVLQFSVVDTGIGIAPENIDQLFKPFVQLDSTLSRRYAGTGLGLALVRRIVELHGGSVSLESELNKGSRFTVSLPWKESMWVEESSLERKPAVGKLLDIHQALIIEDSETAAKQVARYLAEQGTTTYVHPCGEGTIQAALSFKPDVIILDLLLPNVSGWEVLQELKANPATKPIPVLVVSVVDERSQALDLGASEYLLKPFNREELQLALSKIFVHASQPDSQRALVMIGEARCRAANMPQTKRQPPLILLAEDNEANISTLVDYLQLQVFRVSWARNGLEAVQIAKQQKPDLILMDIQMPQMDGLEATRLIRAEVELATIPIVALTALAMPGDRERCLGAGATEYLTKPVGLKKLMNIITQYINSATSG